jgi:hypothetical protein
MDSGEKLLGVDSGGRRLQLKQQESLNLFTTRESWGVQVVWILEFQEF